MPTPEPTPADQLSREDVARIEVGQTRVTPAVARLLVACVLAGIAAVMVAEWVAARSAIHAGSATAWSHLARLVPSERHADVRTATHAGRQNVWQQLVAANRTVLAGMSAFERELERTSVLGRMLRPPAQLFLTTWLGVGNERVYRGRDGWLFYRPDVDYLVGRGFLDAAWLKQRRAATAEWETPVSPDPRVAIRHFHEVLAARGITLIVMPTPVKPAIHPERLVSRPAGTDAALHNASYAGFVEDLRREGILVFDPSDTMAGARHEGAQYLATDTHWRPEAMEAVAEQLAAFVMAHATLPRSDDPGYRVRREEARNTGDVARLLDLPAGSRLLQPESVWLRQVLQADGSPWRSSREADVLVLGDSFANIYSLESLGWGTSAGLVEQLSYALGRPLDRVVQNDDGAYATREMLWREPDRLVGKRVVIYQFAARELAIGDWRLPGP